MAMCEIRRPFWLWAFPHFLGVRMARIQLLATRSSTIEFLWRLAACAFGRETFCSETLTESARFQPKRRMKSSRMAHLAARRDSTALGAFAFLGRILSALLRRIAIDSVCPGP